MSLYGGLPETIAVCGVEYPIETDFRTWIRFQSTFTHGGTNDEKAEKLCCFMESLGVPVTKESLDEMVRFYAGASTENSAGGGKSVVSFDFEKDSEYIFSAFLGAYGIDLTTAKIHWWKFKALFKAIPDDCMMSRIMWYRTVDMNDVPKNQRKRIAKMKRVYSLGTSSSGKTLREHVEELKRKQAESRVPSLRSAEQSSVD